MKIKGIILTAAICAGSVVGISYGVSRVMRSNVKPVEVVDVESVNTAGYNLFNSDTISGTVVSRDTQSVELDDEHKLVAVYVTTGDNVKKGDKLLEYDMTADELKAESADLDRRSLELSLKNLEKDLELLRSGKMPGEDEIDDSDDSADAEGEEIDLTGSDFDPAALARQADAEGKAAVLGISVEEYLAGQENPAAGEASPQPVQENPAAQESAPAASPAAEGQGSSGGEAGSSVEDMAARLDAQNKHALEMMGSGSSGNESMAQQASAVFLASVRSAMDTAQYDPDHLENAAGTINTGIQTFRNDLSVSSESPYTDLLGRSVTKRTYLVSDAVRGAWGDSVADSMQEGYDRLCVYQFLILVKQLNPDGKPSSQFKKQKIKKMSSKLEALVDAYTQIQSSVLDPDTGKFKGDFRNLNADVFGDESYAEFVENMAGRLSGARDEPDNSGNNGGGGSFGWGDDWGGGYTAEELAEAIANQEKSIKECRLQIREAELQVKEYERLLENRVVCASMDGVVTSAGTMEEEPDSGPFILISGKAGLYVKGTISEMELESIRVGDTITGMSYDTGSEFTAEITEISPYPSDSNNVWYYGMGSGNTNSSYYPFYAFIENADGIEVDSSVDLTLPAAADSAGGISLDSYYVRTDANGKSYCYVMGDDGLLEKRYIKTGSNSYGTVQILSGLKKHDYIAFPYGDQVKEGAETVIVSSLSALGW